jgi:hypothetical protein
MPRVTGPESQVNAETACSPCRKGVAFVTPR